jgi:ankyrin repeat protein
MIKTTLWIVFLCLMHSLQAMEITESVSKHQEESVKLDFARISLRSQIIHGISQSIASCLLQDKAITLLHKTPTLAFHTVSDKETALAEIFVYLKQRYPQEIIEDIGITLCFHLLFSKESASCKQGYIELMLPYIPAKQQDFFILIKDTILPEQNLLGPNTSLTKGVRVLKHSTNPLLDSNSPPGVTLLHLAALANNPQVLLCLLSLQGNVNQQCCYKSTPLHYAASPNAHEVTRILLEYGSNSTIQNTGNHYPFNVALLNKAQECAQLLLEDSTFLKNKLAREEAIASSLSYGNSALATFLCSQLKKLSFYKELPQTIKLYFAIARHACNFSKFYDSACSYQDYTERKVRPLHIAALFNNEEALRWLIQHGEKVNITDALGYSPLHYAIEQKHNTLIPLLLHSGVDREAKATTLKKTPLHLAIDKDNEDAVALLIQAQANLDEPAFDGSPLHRALKKNATGIAELLIEAGANISAYESFDFTPLHIAANKGNIPILKLLLEKGASINAQGIVLPLTPLGEAIFEQESASIQFLIEAGADLTLCTPETLALLLEIVGNPDNTFSSGVKETISSFLTQLSQEQKVKILYQAARLHYENAIIYIASHIPQRDSLSQSAYSDLLASIRSWCTVLFRRFPRS